MVDLYIPKPMDMTPLLQMYEAKQNQQKLNLLQQSAETEKAKEVQLAKQEDLANSLSKISNISDMITKIKDPSGRMQMSLFQSLESDFQKVYPGHKLNTENWQEGVEWVTSAKKTFEGIKDQNQLKKAVPNILATGTLGGWLTKEQSDTLTGLTEPSFSEKQNITMRSNVEEARQKEKLGIGGNEPTDTQLYATLINSDNPAERKKAEDMLNFRRAGIEESGAITKAKKEAEQEVEFKVSFPKVRNTMDALNMQWDLVEQTIQSAIEDVSPYTAGVGAWLSSIPATPQKDLAEKLETIKAKVGFDKLQQMRADSPTGGALGQVSDPENKLLQSVKGSLDQRQSATMLKKNLNSVLNNLRAIRDERVSAFSKDYGKFMGTGTSDVQNIQQRLDEVRKKKEELKKKLEGQ